MSRSSRTMTPIIHYTGPNVANDSVINSYSETEFFTDECKDKVSNVTANSYKPNAVIDVKKRLGKYLIAFFDRMMDSGKKFVVSQKDCREIIMLNKLLPYEVELKLQDPAVALQNSNTSSELQKEELERCWIKAIKAKYDYYLLNYDTCMKKFMEEIFTACHLKENNFEDYKYFMEDIFGLVKFDEEEDADLQSGSETDSGTDSDSLTDADSLTDRYSITEEEFNTMFGL